LQSVSSARFVTPPLTRRKLEPLNALLNQFVESVNFIQKCLEHSLTSRASLHRVACGEWKPKFNLETHWFHSAGQVVTQMLRSWRRLRHKGQPDPGEQPVYEARAMRPELGAENSSGVRRFHGNSIQIRIRLGEHLWLPLVVTKRHELTCLQDWRRRKLKVGEITISVEPEKIPVQNCTGS